MGEGRAGVNISHENQNFFEADPKNFKTFPNKKNPIDKLSTHVVFKAMGR